MRHFESSVQAGIGALGISWEVTGPGNKGCVHTRRTCVQCLTGLVVLLQDIIAQLPNVQGASFVPIILGSDKTTVSVATGQNEYYPLYLSIGNITNSVRRAHRNAVVVIGFLAIPKSASQSYAPYGIRTLTCIAHNSGEAIHEYKGISDIQASIISFDDCYNLKTIT